MSKSTKATKSICPECQSSNTKNVKYDFNYFGMNVKKTILECSDCYHKKTLKDESTFL